MAERFPTFMQSELVSICLPVYNRKRLIRSAIGSLLGQSWQNLEIIVVDDASTDGTPEVVDSISDARIRLYIMPRNMGNLYCRNFAFGKAGGRYVAIMDSDDVSHRDRIFHQVSLMRSGLDICASWAYVIDHSWNIQRVWRVPELSSVLRVSVLFGSPFPNPSVMLSSAYLEASDFAFDELYYPAADYHAWVSAIFDGNAKVGIVNKPLVSIRSHEASISTEKRHAQLLMAERIREAVLTRFEVDSSLIALHNKLVKTPSLVNQIESDALYGLYFDLLPEKDAKRFGTLKINQFFQHKLNGVPDRSRCSTYTAPQVEVSVVVTACNAAQYLEECLTSVPAGNQCIYEIVVVDDGSTDDTQSICERLSISIPRIRYCRQIQQGLSNARNTGLGNATGQYVFFLLSTDLLQPGALDLMYRAAMETRADVVVAAHNVVDESGQNNPGLEICQSYLIESQIFTAYVAHQFGHAAYNKLIERGLAESIAFRPDLSHPDALYCPELYLKAGAVCMLAETTYLHRSQYDVANAQAVSKSILDWKTIVMGAVDLANARELGVEDGKAMDRLLDTFQGAMRCCLGDRFHRDQEQVMDALACVAAVVEVQRASMLRE